MLIHTLVYRAVTSFFHGLFLLFLFVYWRKKKTSCTFSVRDVNVLTLCLHWISHVFVLIWTVVFLFSVPVVFLFLPLHLLCASLSPDCLTAENNDDRVLQCCLQYQSLYPECAVILCTWVPPALSPYLGCFSCCLQQQSQCPQHIMHMHVTVSGFQPDSSSRDEREMEPDRVIEQE